MDEPKQWDKAVLDQIWKERMYLSYKPLLLLAMCEACDASGRATIRNIAQYFSSFFQTRRDSGKQEDDLKGFAPGNVPSDRSLTDWEGVIRSEPLARMSRTLLDDEGPTVVWADNQWLSWSTGFKKALQNTAETRPYRTFRIARARWLLRTNYPYSYLSATTGSTFVALRAGM